MSGWSVSMRKALIGFLLAATVATPLWAAPGERMRTAQQDGDDSARPARAERQQARQEQRVERQEQRVERQEQRVERQQQRVEPQVRQRSEPSVAQQGWRGRGGGQGQQGWRGRGDAGAQTQQQQQQQSQQS